MIHYFTVLLLSLMLLQPAFAERFAIVVANNQGWVTEPTLRFSHHDARRLANTLKEVGHFPAQNIVILTDSSPMKITAEIRRLSSRLSRRAEHVAGESNEDLFVFYYSGHADEAGLHPGRGSLSYRHLKQLLAAIPVSLRIALIDSCKSGALTQLKGRAGPAFDVDLDKGDRVRGSVFITAAAASEAAQESRKLRGSFFTSYVAAGLRGAADSNRDGDVTLPELYAFTYAMTVGATSKTLAGVQHPAHRIDLQGRGKIVLTQPGKARACLVVPAHRERPSYLVVSALDDRLVVQSRSKARSISRLALQPGRYRIRRWTPDGVYEESLELLAGECRRIRPKRMKKVLLPDSLNKGELMSATYSLGVGYIGDLGVLDDGALPKHQVGLSLRVPLGHWALRPELQIGHERYSGRIMDLRSTQFRLLAAVTYEIPTAWGLLSAGPLLGMSILRQDTELLGAGPGPDSSGTQHSVGLVAAAALAWEIPLPFWHLALGVRARLGYGNYGFDRQAIHSFFAQLGSDVRVWW